MTQGSVFSKANCACGEPVAIDPARTMTAAELFVACDAISAAYKSLDDEPIGDDDEPWTNSRDLVDELHEITRDGQIEIDRLNRRCDGLIFGGLCIASGCFVTGLLLGGWLL